MAGNDQSPHSPRVRWGILGTGAIARAFAHNLQTSDTGTLVAVASRAQSSADGFADAFGISHRFARYDDLLLSSDVDAVYVALPHPMHAMWAIRAADAKKHLLVEKPLGVNHAEAMAIVEAAASNNVFLMEAFMYRCHLQTQRLIELIRDEHAIGAVRLIEASFAYHSRFDPDGRHFKNALGGGGILDVGCYPVSMARLIAGAAAGKAFANPIDVKGVGQLGQTGVDEWAAASLRFEGGIIAQLTTGIRLDVHNVVRIFGSEGHIELPAPWTLNRTSAESSTIRVHRDGQSRTITIDAQRTAFTDEADVAGHAILSGAVQAPAPAMSWDDSLGNMQALDRWRESIGVAYEFEKPANFPTTTVSGKSLARSPRSSMTYATIKGIDQPVSRLVMGCDNQGTLPHAAVMFDDYFERGGNTFDTANLYSRGLQERLLGQWLKLRGVRDRVVILCKGGHTPYCNPIDVSTQLVESLARLQIDRADIYLLHRDNPQIPAGEFIDVLNAHVNAGRIILFGASNWSIARVDEANAYAKRNGVRGFTALSNNFSLARMVNPVWEGCVAASDAPSRAWLAMNQMPLFSWSSQARGFFLPGRAAPELRDDEELVRGWYSDDNFERRDRVMQLAKTKGVSPISIALAYVLHQPFPTFALIGPRQLSETRSSFEALEVRLSEDETRWLNLES